MNRPSQDVQLATIWQVERDGHLVYELRIPTPDQYSGNPTSEDVWQTFVCIAVEDAVNAFRASHPPVTNS